MTKSSFDFQHPPSKDFSIGGKLWPGLSKLIEECGEVIQVAGKLIGNHGREIHYSGAFLDTDLEKELGDLKAAIEFVITYNCLDRNAISKRKWEKFNTFCGWHKEGN